MRKIICSSEKRFSQNISHSSKNINQLLITDISEIITDNSGNTTENPSVLTDLPEAKLKEEWTWNFDLRKSDYYRKKSVFKVTAMIL